jgi:hypothetical protein
MHTQVDPLLLGLWGGSTLWWEHMADEVAHLLEARK